MCVCVQVVQPDKFTLCLRLRTPLSHSWLHLSWHPTAARLCVGRPPTRGDVSEGFALAQQVIRAHEGRVHRDMCLGGEGGVGGVDGAL